MFEVLTLVAAASWWPIYESPAFVVMAVVTVTAGVLIGAAGARWSWPGYLVLAALVVAWAALGVPLAVPAEAAGGVLPSPSGLVDLVVTTGTGWKQLLTIALPVGSYQALLVPAFVLLLVASTLGVTVATRSSRPAFAVLLPALVLVAGIALGGPDAFAPALVGGAFAVVSVLWLVVSRGRVPIRVLGPAAALVVVGLVAALAVAVATPAPDRVVARDAVQQPFDASRYASPLSGYRAQLKQPADASVQLQLSGAAPGERIVVARMDSYDGVVFSVGGATGSSSLFSRVPGTLPGGQDAANGSRVDVVVGAYQGVWVPTVGVPSAIDFSGPNASALQNSLFASAALGTVADTAGLTTGDSYTLTTRLDSAVTDTTGLTPGALVTGANASAPDAVGVRAATWAPDSLSPGLRLSGIVAGLRSGYVSSGLPGEVFSRSGHGADRIQELLTATPMVGDDEQYAAAGALLAEAAGFPARVATGFTVPGAGGVSESGSGGGAAIAVRGADAHAWVEVYTAEAGWVALDVTPAPRPIPDASVDESSSAVRPPEVIPPATEDLADPGNAAPLQQNDSSTPPGDGALATVLRIAAIAGLSLVVLAVLLAPFLLALALKARRRTRRRGSGSARSRAAGGWAEVVDTARDLREPPVPNATRREAARSLGGGPATALAERVDGALFAPVEPSEAELRAIWEASDAERRRLRIARGRFVRLRARVSWRSLRAYHGKDRKRQDDQ